jgi:hypothetical protein
VAAGLECCPLEALARPPALFVQIYPALIVDAISEQQWPSGLIVKLPGWDYPAVVDAATGTVAFVKAWGEQKELDKLFQAYASEKARVDARCAPVIRFSSTRWNQIEIRGCGPAIR